MLARLIRKVQLWARRNPGIAYIAGVLALIFVMVSVMVASLLLWYESPDLLRSEVAVCALAVDILAVASDVGAQSDSIVNLDSSVSRYCTAEALERYSAGPWYR